MYSESSCASVMPKPPRFSWPLVLFGEIFHATIHMLLKHPPPPRSNALMQWVMRTLRNPAGLLQSTASNATVKRPASAVVAFVVVAVVVVEPGVVAVAVGAVLLPSQNPNKAIWSSALVLFNLGRCPRNHRQSLVKRGEKTLRLGPRLPASWGAPQSR